MQPNPMQAAIAASLYGPYRSRLHVGGHHFDIRTAHTSRVGSVLHVNGHISHSVENAPNHEILYEFSLEGGVLKEPRTKISDDPFTALVGLAAEIVGKFKDIKISRAEAERWATELTQAVFGNWQHACSALVATIALAFLVKESEGGLEKEPSYRVLVKTGDIKDAGTDANVYITLFGRDRKWSEPRILDNEENNFERGKEDVIYLTMKDIGEVDRVIIGHDDSGEHAGWFLEKVVVEREDLGKSWTFEWDGTRQAAQGEVAFNTR